MVCATRKGGSEPVGASGCRKAIYWKATTSTTTLR
jgi:hypothetical protein